MEKKYKTNKEMQKVCDYSDDYCPIDYSGELQTHVDDETRCIVDCSADEQMRFRKSDNEMMVIMDRRGERYYPTVIVPWWQ